MTSDPIYLNLEQFRPQLAGDEQSAPGSIVGNAVEHVGAAALFLLR
jgi:hypothetical protein